MGLVPDFLLDYISVNTYWTILFIVHALLAVALLGALTHQAAAVLAVGRAAGHGFAHLVAGACACLADAGQSQYLGHPVRTCHVRLFLGRGFAGRCAQHHRPAWNITCRALSRWSLLPTTPR